MFRRRDETIEQGSHKLCPSKKIYEGITLTLGNAKKAYESRTR